ncbi:MAG: DNA polymerase III subunit gamma/tau [Gammaproteobacteria bacterium]|nr:DNA polymerase III subunit gamma/tau [Gammaproteobacteria bacterium]
MTYIALARKWRPRTFTELLGQTHLTRALSQSLKQGRVHHAYLFTGTRGVGKTSVARILAKALNCEQGVSENPCLTCDTCQAIEQGRFIDLIEIDAASKTRVEDTRELLDNVQYAPSTGRFKIYLIDEVHMLSQHSFNALLKTLEEPPAHVKFLLATTDAQKLPITILSRCLQFHLNHVSDPIIATHLQTILNDENIASEPQALTLIAKAARGSMRDALSLLDQALAGRNGDLTVTDVSALLGHTAENVALQLLHALCDHDPQQLMTLSRDIARTGGQYRYVLDELLGYLHRIAVVHALPSVPNEIETDPDIADLAQQLSAEDTQLFYQIGLKGVQDLPYAPTLSIGFEMIMLRMFTFQPAATGITPKLAYQAPPTEKITRSETPVTEAVTIPDDILDTAPESKTEPLAPQAEVKTEAITSAPDIKTEPSALSWEDIITQSSLNGLALTAIKQTQLLEKRDGEVILKVEKAHQSIFTTPVITRIQDCLTQYYQEPIQLNFEYHEVVTHSPAAKKKMADSKAQEAHIRALEEDPVFQQIQTTFSADLDKNSITIEDIST